MMELVNLLGAAVLLVLGRKLVWCLRWLWCYYHGQEVPDPIPWIPRQTGETFDGHIQRGDKED